MSKEKPKPILYFILFIKKLGVTLISLWVISTITFFLIKSVPGDPFSKEKPLPPEILAALHKHYGLSDPWYIQYANYMKGIATCNLGPSYKYKSQTVNQIIRQSFPVSALLGSIAMLIAVSGGCLTGAISALKAHQWQDRTAMLLAVLGISVPSFVLAALLQYVLAAKLHLFPIARWSTWHHTVLPSISLAAAPLAFLARLCRSNFLEVFSQDYIQVAKAKGLSPFYLTLHHACKNALLPLIPYLGQLTANILVGSFVIEKIFGIPGLGQWFVTSVGNRDYSVIMGITVFNSFILLLSVLFFDMLHAIVDPRLKEERS